MPEPWFAAKGDLSSIKIVGSTDSRGRVGYALRATNPIHDTIGCVDAKTSRSVEYPLPDNTNIHRVFVDNRTNPVTFWTGSNHDTAIVKVEALE